MGSVYRARDLHFPNVVKLVAVKEMINNARDPLVRKTIIQNFEREANILVTLNHPAIPKIFDYFSYDERSYLVLEYVNGRDLEAILAEEDGPLPEDQVIAWSIEILDVLEYLHNHKPEPIIFRDLKPSNIMINQNVLKLVVKKDEAPNPNRRTAELAAEPLLPMLLSRLGIVARRNPAQTADDHAIPNGDRRRQVAAASPRRRPDHLRRVGGGGETQGVHVAAQSADDVQELAAGRDRGFAAAVRVRREPEFRAVGGVVRGDAGMAVEYELRAPRLLHEDGRAPAALVGPRPHPNALNEQFRAQVGLFAAAALGHERLGELARGQWAFGVQQAVAEEFGVGRGQRKSLPVFCSLRLAFNHARHLLFVRKPFFYPR